MLWCVLYGAFYEILFTGGVLQDTLTNGYSPPMTTVIILAVSLGVTYVMFHPQQPDPTIYPSSARLLPLRSGKCLGGHLVGPTAIALADLFGRHKKFPKTRNLIRSNPWICRIRRRRRSCPNSRSLIMPRRADQVSTFSSFFFFFFLLHEQRNRTWI